MTRCAAALLLLTCLSGCGAYVLTRCAFWCGGDQACCGLESGRP